MNGIYYREDYDEFSRQNFVLERQMTPEYGTPVGLMSGHMSPQQHRNSPAFRDSPHSQRGYRPHRDSPLVNSPTHEEPPQHFGRPSSRKRGDMKESGSRYSSSSQQEDYHYGSSPAEICYGSSSNYEHDDNRYLDQNTHINDGQESGMKCHEFKVGFCIQCFLVGGVVHVYINKNLEVILLTLELIVFISKMLLKLMLNFPYLL